MITLQAPQHMHTRIIILISYMHFVHQAACGERRFSRTLVQAPVIQIPPSYHVRKGNKVPVWFCRIQLKASGREKRCWKGRKNSAKCEGPRHCWTFFTVGDWHIATPCVMCRGCKTSDVILWLHSTPIIEFSVLCCNLRTELNTVCLYGLYQELGTLPLYYYYILLVLLIEINLLNIAMQFS